jgi:hypothetical protein
MPLHCNKLILLYAAVIFLAVNAHSQQSFQGSILDSKTKSPIPYASIKVRNKNTQSIANADGRFLLPPDHFSIRDTLIISCVGYLPKSVPVRALGILPVIKLDPVIFQLTAVDIKDKGNLDYPYQLFSDLCQKYRKYKVADHAKAYFSFLSSYNEIPLEIIEGYFNGDVILGNDIQLSLKNGRIGLNPVNFYSLNTTDILTHFSPFSLSGNLNIPSSAGNFSFHRLKRLFDLKIISTTVEGGNKECILQFLAKKDTSTLFSGLAWINRSENTIEKLEYFIKASDFFYLKPAIKGDKTDSTEVSLIYLFDNSNKDHPLISRVSLDYSLLYTSLKSNNTIKITSEGNLFFYDYAVPFAKTFPAGLMESLENDYQKISCLPYDSVFWSSPGITPQSDKQKVFIDFFRTNGVLVNFSKSLDSLAGSCYIPWNAGSDIAFTDILNRTPKHEMQLVSESQSVASFKQTGNEPFNINCKILFNPVVMGDSLHLSSVTLLDKLNSYYFLGHSYKATAFINLTFDLCEQERREILERCRQAEKQHKLTVVEFESVYDEGMMQLKRSINLLNTETINGTSVAGLLKWYRIISAKLGNDRSVLMEKMASEGVGQR